MLDADLKATAQTKCRAACAEFCFRENLPWSTPFVLRPHTDLHSAQEWFSKARHDSLLTSAPAFAASAFPDMAGRIFFLGAENPQTAPGLDLRMGDVGRCAMELLGGKVISAVSGSVSALSIHGSGNSAGAPRTVLTARKQGRSGRKKRVPPETRSGQMLAFRRTRESTSGPASPRPIAGLRSANFVALL